VELVAVAREVLDRRDLVEEFSEAPAKGGVADPAIGILLNLDQVGRLEKMWYSGIAFPGYPLERYVLP